MYNVLGSKMKIRNTTNNTVYVEDVDLYLPYKNGDIEEIDPDILKKSKGLRSFIISGTIEVAGYDPNERIEASIMFLKSQQAQRTKESEETEEIFISDLETNVDDIEVRIHGIFYDAGGYGKVNRNLALKLHEAGIKVRVDPKKSQNQLKASELNPIIALTNTKISRNHISIDSVIPSFAEYSTGKYRILYTTIESYSVPKQFLECCQMYNEIWLTCLTPESIIETPSGGVAISQTRIGDEVISGEGKIERITNRRSITHDGEIIKITTKTGYQLKMTPNHKLLVRQTMPFDQTLSRIPGYSEVVRHLGKDRSNRKRTQFLVKPPDFIQASEISPEDWVLSPIRTNNIKTSSPINILDFVGPDWRVKNDNIFRTFNFKRKNTQATWNIDRDSKVKKNFELDSDIAYVFGIYAAEGSDDGDSISFVMSSCENLVLHKIKTVINSKFGLNSTIRSPSSIAKSLELRTCSRLISEFFRNILGKGAINKKVPKFIFTSSDEIKTSFLNGVFDGDGWLGKNSIHLRTVSPILRNGCVSLLLSLNLLPSISEDHKLRKNRKWNITSRHPTYALRVGGKQFLLSKLAKYNKKSSGAETARSANNHILDDRGYWHKIKTVEIEKYQGNVIDIEVSGDNTFCAQSICSHNSEWSASILKKHVNKPIYVIPAGVDPVLYVEEGPRFDFKPNIKSFVFLSVFGWGYRKGYDVLLKAYFEEFDASDDVSLLISSRYQSGTSRFHRDKIRDDINNIMRKYPNKDMPHVVRYSQVIPEEQMPQLYRAADCFVLPTRGEGSCNLPGTKIVTSTGLKSIETIVDKELVLTHKGKYCEVLETMKRYINEDVCEINVLTHHDKICLTKDHPVFVLKKKNCWIGDRKDVKCFTHNNCEWEKASNLSRGDYLLFPANFCKKQNLTKISLRNYLDHDEFIFENDRIFRKSSNQYSKDFKHSTAKSYLDELVITESLLKLIGFYIAEGYVYKSKITFTFHKNEDTYHNEVTEALLKNFAQKTRITLFKNTLSAQICCSNYIVSKLLSSWCGNGAYEKHLPDFVWDLNENQIMYVLYGLFSGDGCFTKKQKKSLSYLSLTSVSQRLCDEVSVLLRSIGINGRQSFNSNRTYSININGNQLNKLRCIKNSSHSGMSKNYCIKNEDYLFLPITNISNQHYEGHVYNLEVCRDNSYANNCFIVHNCLPPVEASLCGLPIIMTNISGQQMYLRDDNAFLIEMDRLIKTPTGYFGIHYWDGQKFPALTTQGVTDQLRKTMRYVIEHPGEAQKRNRRLQKLIKEQFTWNNTANAALRRLREIKKEIMN